MKQPLIRLPFLLALTDRASEWRSAMSKKEYEKPQDILAHWDDVKAMTDDDTMIVVMAIPAGVENMFNITYFSREDRELPPWIIDRKAA